MILFVFFIIFAIFHIIHHPMENVSILSQMTVKIYQQIKLVTLPTPLFLFLSLSLSLSLSRGLNFGKNDAFPLQYFTSLEV